MAVIYTFFRNLSYTFLQKIFYKISKHQIFINYPWIWNRFYPYIALKLWNRSEWPEYQQWINKNSLKTYSAWRAQQQADSTRCRVSFSIVTPVYNTAESILVECILSLRMQTNPHWELILVNDASSRKETLDTLKSAICQDPRIHILTTENSSASGISAATNVGIKYASGDFIVFLDHDDRLAAEAIHYLSQTVEQFPETDIVYSDRDMISPADKRFMHLMKPDWSPENFLSGNYIFHLMCYRKSLITAVGGLRSEYDGSQDYDLILRCMEQPIKVRHIKRVLYHWRQHVQSIALNDDSKSYVFDAGIDALQEAMKRRGISASISHIESLWRGNYRTRLALAEDDSISRIYFPETMPAADYAEFVLSHPLLNELKSSVLLCSSAYKTQNPQAENELASWLQLDDVGMACGKLLDQDEKIVYAGMFYADDGEFIRPYSGYSADEAGYLAITSVLRNISSPNPYCVIIKRELWQQLGGFKQGYHGPHALLDFAFRAQEAGWRIVFDPMAVYSCAGEGALDDFVQSDSELLQQQWKEKLLEGDPYYSQNLAQHSLCYELNLD